MFEYHSSKVFNTISCVIEELIYFLQNYVTSSSVYSIIFCDGLTVKWAKHVQKLLTSADRGDRAHEQLGTYLTSFCQMSKN